jgi:hypothetical protein
MEKKLEKLVKSWTVGRWYVAVVEAEANSFNEKFVVKFYDTKYVFGKDYADNVNPNGYQFTCGSYFSFSIMEHNNLLNFYGDVPEWTISYQELLKVKELILQVRNA